MKNTFPVRGLSQHVPMSDEVTRQIGEGIFHVFDKALVDKFGQCLLSAVASVDELHASVDEESGSARLTFLESGSGEEGRRLLVNRMAELRFSSANGCLFLDRRPFRKDLPVRGLRECVPIPYEAIQKLRSRTFAVKFMGDVRDSNLMDVVGVVEDLAPSVREGENFASVLFLKTHGGEVAINAIDSGLVELVYVPHKLCLAIAPKNP